jgi:hypothetical protein
VLTVLDQGDVGADAGVELGELASDRSAAEDDEPLRDLAGARRLSARPVVQLAEPLDRGCHGHGPGGDQELLVLDVTLADLDAARLGHHTCSTRELDVELSHPLRLALVVLLRNLVAPPEDALNIHVPETLRGPGREPGPMEHLERA